MEPSRWRCSSAFGREAMRLSGNGSVMRKKSARQLRPAGVYPRGEPERAHIGCGVGELADQNGRGLIVEAVVIFVGEGVFSATRVAVGEKNVLQPAVRAEAGFESAVRGVIDKNGVVGAHGEKGRIAVDQRGPEALVDSRLAAQASVEIIRGVERIVG